MSLIVYTDPHLGLQRAAHTTPESKRRLQDALFDAVAKIHALKGPGDELINVGDFFDTYSNPEEVTARAAPLLSELDYCLSGNHDVVGRESKMGSLELLDQVLPRGSQCRLEVISSAYGESVAKCWLNMRHNCTTTFVPHVATSSLFDNSLEKAMLELDKARQVVGADWAGKHYLFLHCNYDNELAAEKEATLNLSSEDAKILLEHGFDYIVLGHVHQPSDHLGGRVIVLGNTHPTGFGDLGYKRILVIDERGSPSFRPIYDAEAHEVGFDLDEYLGGRITIGPEVRFATMTGDIGPERAADLAKAVKELWNTCPGLMALRSVVSIKSNAVVRSADTVAFNRLPEHIEKELKDRPRLLAIWKEVTQNA